MSWHVERDVTALLSYLARKHDAFVEVPNVVNKIYDGEIFVSASITLYFSDDNQASSPPPVVIGITAANVTKSSRLAAIGRSRIAYPFVSPVRNAVRAQALIFASGHACEEFWYSNLPTADAAPGACSGGAFRLLEVLLDGLVVGRASPFPVVYTGGINPLLWHPLTGILSFDIVPYAFDISPFVSIINDGGRHTLEVRVVTGEEGNRTADNVWFVDAEILLWRHVHALELVGEVRSHDVSPVVVSVTRKRDEVWDTLGRASVNATGCWCTTYNNSCTCTTTTTTLDIHGHIENVGAYRQIANSVSKREVIINNEQRSHFRYAIDSDTSVPPVPPHELVIFARVRLERRREIELCTSNASKISWVSEMHGSALLNETLRSGNAALSAVTHPPQSSMRMSERFEVDSNDMPCYVLMRASVNGTCAPTPAPRPVDARACSFPHGVEMCGVELCSDSLAACCYG